MSLNTYRAFFRGKQIDVEAPTSYAAQQKAALQFKARKSYDVTVILLAKADGVPVVHDGAELSGS